MSERYRNTILVMATAAAVLLLMTLAGGCGQQLPTADDTDEIQSTEHSPFPNLRLKNVYGAYDVELIQGYDTSGKAVQIQWWAAEERPRLTISGAFMTLSHSDQKMTYFVSDALTYVEGNVEHRLDAPVDGFFAIEVVDGLPTLLTTVQYKTLDDGRIQLDAKLPFFKGASAILRKQ